MRNLFLVRNNLIRTFVGLPFSNKVQKTISIQNAADGVKLAKTYSGIFIIY